MFSIKRRLARRGIRAFNSAKQLINQYYSRIIVNGSTPVCNKEGWDKTKDKQTSFVTEEYAVMPYDIETERAADSAKIKAQKTRAMIEYAIKYLEANALK